jgi:hypothetical protein
MRCAPRVGVSPRECSGVARFCDRLAGGRAYDLQPHRRTAKRHFDSIGRRALEEFYFAVFDYWA